MNTSQTKKTSKINFLILLDNNRVAQEEQELEQKASYPEKLLDSIIQSRCLTKEQPRKHPQKDKLSS